jgi:uncharacterized membrane protein
MIMQETNNQPEITVPDSVVIPTQEPPMQSQAINKHKVTLANALAFIVGIIVAFIWPVGDDVGHTDLTMESIYAIFALISIVAMVFQVINKQIISKKVKISTPVFVLFLVFVCTMAFIAVTIIRPMLP